MIKESGLVKGVRWSVNTNEIHSDPLYPLSSYDVVVSQGQSDRVYNVNEIRVHLTLLQVIQSLLSCCPDSPSLVCREIQLRS